MEFRVCSGEIPPCSFETARRLLWRNTNNELLPVYDRQLCEWYLQTQILRCECLGDNKWLLISLKSEFVTQIWGKSTAFPQIWVTNSDLSDQLKFEWNRLVSPRFEWTLKFERSPRIEGITSDHPELSASPNVEGGHLPGGSIRLNIRHQTIGRFNCNLIVDDWARWGVARGRWRLREIIPIDLDGATWCYASTH